MDFLSELFSNLQIQEFNMIYLMITYKLVRNVNHLIDTKVFNRLHSDNDFLF